MAKVRSRRDEARPESGDLAVRGILGSLGLTPDDLRAAAVLNHDLYGFFGVSVWIPDAQHPLDRVEQTKLVKFSQYAVFSVADLLSAGLEVWATGQSPHYDVVHADLEALIGLISVTPHQIRLNPHVDREER